MDSLNEPGRLDYLPMLPAIARGDLIQLDEAERKYGDSWLKRGGIGAYFVTVRKFDRIETIVKSFGYDIFRALQNDLDSGKPEAGLIDDVRDLRCYLAAWEAQGIARGHVKPRLLPRPTRDDDPPHPAPPEYDASLALTLLDRIEGLTKHLNGASPGISNELLGQVDRLREVLRNGRS